MKSDLFIVTGAPSTGKTTLLNNLKKDLHNLQIFEEVGGICSLRYKVPFYKRCDEKDDMIMKQEFERDNNIFNKNFVYIGLEQWHFGNIIFAYLRNYNNIEKYIQAFGESISKNRPLFVFNLKVTKDQYKKRRSELGFTVNTEELDFISKWDEVVNKFTSEFKLNNFSINASKSTEEIKNTLKYCLLEWRGENVTYSGNSMG